jgi:hypothetical protein
MTKRKSRRKGNYQRQQRSKIVKGCVWLKQSKCLFFRGSFHLFFMYVLCDTHTILTHIFRINHFSYFSFFLLPFSCTQTQSFILFGFVYPKHNISLLCLNFRYFLFLLLFFVLFYIWPFWFMKMQNFFNSVYLNHNN